MMSRSQARSAPGGDRRSAPRFRLQVQAQRVESGAAFFVTIHNISEEGLLVEAESTLEQGEALALMLPDGQRTPANIVWRSGSFYGAEFQGPISAALLRRTHAASKIVWPSFVAAARHLESPGGRSEAGHGGAATHSGPTAAPLLPVSVRIQIVLAVSAALWASLLAPFCFAI